MANDERLTIAMTVPNTLIADRRVNMSVGCGSLAPLFECSMAFSIGIFFIEPFSIRSVSVTGKRDVASMFPEFLFDRGRSISPYASIGIETSAGNVMPMDALCSIEHGAGHADHRTAAGGGRPTGGGPRARQHSVITNGRTSTHDQRIGQRGRGHRPDGEFASRQARQARAFVGGKAGTAPWADRSKLPKAAAWHSENCSVHEFDVELGPAGLCRASTSLNIP